VVGTVPEQNALISSSFLALILAASFSGFVTSFLVTPVERVKVMMQAQSTNALYANELECIQAVLKNEGFVGLFSRGLGTTLAREVPSYAIYFVVYGLLIHTSVAENYLGGAAPLLCGAIR
jgi:solute carrier family 25 carnitine/acylcarnitine transporter 20/29